MASVFHQMTRRLAAIAFLLSILLTTVPAMADDGDVNRAIKLYRTGQYEAARALLQPYCESGTCESCQRDELARGYVALIDARMQAPGYEAQIMHFLKDYPYSALTTELRMVYAQNLFDDKHYLEALSQFENLDRRRLSKSHKMEYDFKKAYCRYSLGQTDKAREELEKVEQTQGSSYRTSARFLLGYMAYSDADYTKAEEYFGKCMDDGRFKALSQYYVLECRFYFKDYEYIVENAPALMPSLSQEHSRRLARLLAESYMILDEPDKAKEVFDGSLSEVKAKDDKDKFFIGSMYYAVGDCKTAVTYLESMQDRSDSLGQVANYQLAECYFSLKNKVAALNAFKAASVVDFNPELTKDASLNYARLCFDLNSDATAYKAYMRRYPNPKETDKIYGYIAVAALRNNDYKSALKAFEEIEDLDETMADNYLKANFLMACEYMRVGNYKDAATCLKLAVAFGDAESPMLELSRFHLADALYRTGDYQGSLKAYKNLVYKMNVLTGTRQSKLVNFGMAYDYYKMGDYEAAIRWFTRFRESNPDIYARESLVCIADCHFICKRYSQAFDSYVKVASDYPLSMDAYPYYQAGLCQILLGNYTKAISVLEGAGDISSNAQYYDDALFELGRSYAFAKRNDDARVCFEKVIRRNTSASFVASSYMELGTMERNSSMRDEALAHFKKVVSDFPGTTYADEALMAIESIYEDSNDRKGYLAYLDAIGKSSSVSSSDRERMVYDDAYQLYKGGKYDDALKAFDEYFTAYPEAEHYCAALYFEGQCHKKKKNYEESLECFKKVYSHSENSYTELSVKEYADINYEMKRYEEAFDAYSLLSEKATFEKNLLAARKGMVYSSYKAKQYDKTIKAVPALVSDPSCPAITKREARFMMAKSYLYTSDRDNAMKIFSSLAEYPSSAEGAESAYIVIKDCYDRGDFAAVQQKVFKFSEKGESQQYWLAKSFILLGDSYVEQGQMSQAKATFESIRDGYTPSGREGDDVLESVNMRLDKLSKKK